MNKQKELAKNTIILSFGKICTQFVSFFLLPLYTALLDPKEFGIVDLFNTYILLLVPLFNWQFENGLFRFMLDKRNDRDEQTKVFSTVFFTNCGQAVIYILFYLIFQDFISSEYKIFLAVDVVLNIFLNTFLQFPRGTGNNISYTIGSFISATSAVLMNVVFIAFLKWGALGMFLATVVSKVVTIAYLVISQKIWRYVRAKSYDRAKFREILRYSLPLVPNQLSWWIVNSSDRTIIAHFINTAANGIYAVSNKFSSIYMQFYNIFNMAWNESVSLHINDDDRDDFLTDTINSMFSLFSAVCIGLIACMPFVFDIMIDKKYTEAYPHIPILILSALFQIVIGLYGVIYTAKKKSGEIAKTSVFAAIINIAVNLSLIKFVGLYAASVSTLVAYAVMAVYRYFDIKKYVDVKLKSGLLVSTTVMCIIVMLSYYYNMLVTNIITLLVAVVYAVIINRDFLKSSFDTVRNKLNSVIRALSKKKDS